VTVGTNAEKEGSEKAWGGGADVNSCKRLRCKGGKARENLIAGGRTFRDKNCTKVARKNYMFPVGVPSSGTSTKKK